MAAAAVAQIWAAAAGSALGAPATPSSVPVPGCDVPARTPDEISDAFWGFIAYGVVDEAHRPDDIGSALRTLSALEVGAGGAADRS